MNFKANSDKPVFQFTSGLKRKDVNVAERSVVLTRELIVPENFYTWQKITCEQLFESLPSFHTFQHAQSSGQVPTLPAPRICTNHIDQNSDDNSQDEFYATNQDLITLSQGLNDEVRLTLSNGPEVALTSPSDNTDLSLSDPEDKSIMNGSQESGKSSSRQRWSYTSQEDCYFEAPSSHCDLYNGLEEGSTKELIQNTVLPEWYKCLERRNGNIKGKSGKKFKNVILFKKILRDLREFYRILFRLRFEQHEYSTNSEKEECVRTLLKELGFPALSKANMLGFFPFFFQVHVPQSKVIKMLHSYQYESASALAVYEKYNVENQNGFLNDTLCSRLFYFVYKNFGTGYNS